MKPFAILAACGLAASSVSAQVRAWDNASGGLWGTATNWSPMDVPNTIGETAELSLAGTYTVEIASVNPAIAALDLLNANATVQVNGGRSLTLDGALVNNGLLLVNEGNVGATTILQFNNNTSMSGSGRLRLNGSSSRATVRGANTSVVVSQSANHAIQGYGLLQLGLDNAGLIESDVLNQPLELITTDKLNSGTISATNGSNLDINGITVTQTPMGVITADADALLEIINGDIIGGTIAQSDTGRIETVGTSTLNSVTITGEVDIRAGAVLNLDSTLTNNGVLIVNRNNVGAGTIARFTTNTLLTGTGTLRLNGLTSRAILSSLNSSIVGTNDSGHSIRGFGHLQANLVNNGLIQADTAGEQLTLLTEDKVNNAAIRASNDAELEVNGIILDQTGGGTLTALDSGTIDLSNATVLDGDIVRNAGGIVTSRGTTTLDGVRITGGLEVVGGAVTAITGGLVNNGIIDVNPTNIAAVTDLRYNASGSLTGNGEVRLGGLTARARITGSNSSINVNHGANHTVRGFGQILVAMTNNGTISADTPAEGLFLLTEDKVNNNAMNATGGGSLIIESIQIDQTGGGTISALANGTVDLRTANIVGGTITHGPTGTVISRGISEYQGVTLSGGMEIITGTIADVSAGMINNGSIAVNPTNGGAVTDLRFRDNGTLSGSGEVVLAGSGVRSRVTALNSGVTVTNGASHTIRGSGQITAPFVNNGLVSADVDGQALDIIGEPKLNNTTLRATNNGTLQLGNFLFNQSASGEVVADGGTVAFTSTTLTGGTVRSDNGGSVSFSGIMPVADIAIDADATVVGGASVNTTGTFQNDGTITINPTNAGIVTQIRVDEPMTFEGSGAILLGGTDVRSRIINTVGDVLTNGQGHTIGGVGQIEVELANNGIIAPGLSAGDLDVFKPIACGPTSEIQIELAGENTGEFDRILSNSPIVLDGTIDVRLIDGYAPTSRTVYEVISSSGGITGSFDAITGDDAGNGLVLKWATDGNVVQVAYTCPSDVGFPLGTADIDDVLAFLNAFANQDSLADLAAPQGVFNIDDVLTFLDAFAQGCP